MGCWKRKRRVFVGDCAENRATLALLEALGFSAKDITSLFASFNKIDSDQDGSISVGALCKYLKIEKTPFTQQVFALFLADKGGSGGGWLYFEDFALTVFTFGISDAQALATMAFSFHAEADAAEISERELICMCESVYGETLDAKDRIRRIIKDVLNEDGCITLPEFIKATRDYPLVLYPACHTQTILRRSFMGIEWWERKLKQRGEERGSTLVWDVLAEAGKKVAGFTERLQEMREEEHCRPDHDEEETSELPLDP